MTTTVITPVPFTLKDVSLIIGPTAGTNYDFSADVDTVTFTPSSSQVNWIGLKPTSVFTDVTSATWTVSLGYAQDWDTANSLSKYLMANEGATVDCVFKPKSAGTPTVTAKIVITPGVIGGTVNQVATATVTLGVAGKPTVA